MLITKVTLNMSLILLCFFFVKESYSLPINGKTQIVIDLSQCFQIINETTIEKKDFFYTDASTKEQCTKLALAKKYKEDIFWPKYLHRCFPLCNSCLAFSKKISDMKCISCLNGFKLDQGNCYLNKKYSSKERKNELNTIFNTLNLDPQINSNEIRKRYINGKTYLYKDSKNSNQNSKLLRKLYVSDDYFDIYNTIFNREDQTTLTNDRNDPAYNFHIELSPYYLLAKRCISKGKYFIENKRCVDKCSISLEHLLGYTGEVRIPIGPNNEVTVCDCAFRCCVKTMNMLYKSLDRGFIDGSYHYYRKENGRCASFEKSYYEVNRTNSYVLAQDFVECFFPIYDDNDNIEFYYSGYNKTIIGNNCNRLCPKSVNNTYYYYNPENSGCYKCPENCIECNGIPTETNGHCVKCTEFYNGIVNGFCVDLCPSGYGEKNGIPWICEQCDDDEIIFDNKCVQYQGDTHNYGTLDNPSFKDPVNSIFHRCVEYTGFKQYTLYSNPICPSDIKCPNPFYRDDTGCHLCPPGCSSCEKNLGGKQCLTCYDKYKYHDFTCFPCTYQKNDGTFNECSDSCPRDYYLGEDEDTEKCDIGCMPGNYKILSESNNICSAQCPFGGIIIDETICLLDCSSDYPEFVDGTCVNCPVKGMFNFHGVCIQKDENFDKIYFPLPGEENEKYGKVGSCYISDKLGNYHLNHNISYNLTNFTCPDDCPENFTKKIDSNGEIYCKRCYSSCETCNFTGSQGNHKCTSCKSGYEPSPTMYGICDQIPKEGQYFYYEETRERKASDECPEHMPYIAEPETENQPNLECLSNCSQNNQFLLGNTSICVSECPEGYYIMYSVCVDQCPEAYGPNENLECFNCSEKGLFYYENKCYDITKEIPLDKYLETNDGSNDTPTPGIGNDGTFQDCFQKINIGYKTGYFSRYNNCSRKCPEGYDYDEVSGFCLECGDECTDDDPSIDQEVSQGDCPDGFLSIDKGFGPSCEKDCPEDASIYAPGLDEVEECVSDVIDCIFGDLGDKIKKTYNRGKELQKCYEGDCKDENLYYEPNTLTCNYEDAIPLDTYFDPEDQSDPNENTLSQCLKDLSSTETKTGFYYPISNCQTVCPTYYYYAGDNKCIQCHPLCGMCFGEGTNEENKCLSCIDEENRILNPYLFNCEVKCNSSFHFDTDKKMVCDIDNKCDRNEFIDEITGNCISECNKNIDGNYCVNECPEGKINFQKYCLKDVTIPVIVKTIIVPVEIERTIIYNNPNDNTINNDNQNDNSNTNNINNENNNDNSNTNNINNENNNDNSNTNTNNINNENNNYNSNSLNEYNNIDNNNTNDDSSNINNENNNNDNSNTNNVNSGDDENNNKNNENWNIIEIIKYIERNFTRYFTDHFTNYSNNYYNEGNNNYKVIYASDGKIYLTQLFPNTTILNSGNSFTTLYFLELQKKLKELYPSEDSFYIIEIDFYNKTISPQTKYKIYLRSGEEILINDLYPDMEIIIEKEIIFEKKLKNNTILAYYLIDQGINLFNINDPFFTDICYSFQDEHGNDVIPKNRKEDYFQNILLCIDGCEYIGINTTIKNNYKIICKCKISAFILKNTSDIYNYNINNLPSINYENNDNNILEVVKCADTALSKDEISKNKGLWVYIPFLLMLIGLYIIFCCYDFEPLYTALYPFGKNKIGVKNEEVIEEEIITKKEFITLVNNKETTDKISSKVKKNKKIIENPPKKGEGENNDIEINNEDNNKIKKKYTIRFNDDKKEFPKLKISNFGNEGFKLSNKFDKLDLETIGDLNDNEEEQNYNGNNNNNDIDNYSSPRNNSFSNFSNSYSSHNSPKSDTSINYSQKFSPRKVDLEPEGALLESNNFFDTCRIINIPSYYSNQENSLNIRKMKSKSKTNNLTLKNNRENNGFYKTRSRIVKLPGFPKPEITINENDNPINRNDKILEDIDEDNLDDSSFYNKKTKNIKKELYKKERYNIDILSELDNTIDKEKNSSFHRYQRNGIKKPKTYKSNITNSFTQETLSGRPITINKYYITNNSSEDLDSKEKPKTKNNSEIDYNKNGENTVTIRRRKIKTNQYFYSEYYTKYDLDFADFENFLLYEKRSFCQMYISLLSNFQIFLSVFMTLCAKKGSVYIPWCVRGGIAVFTMELYFTGIALFITFKNLEQRYKFNDTIDIIYLIKNEFSSILYTSLISKIMNLVTMYFLVHYSITKVIKEYAFREDLFLEKIKEEIKRLKCKYHIFFIICIILTIAQGYYLSCFCGVFKGAIKPWIFSSLITFALNFIISFLIILIANGFRKIALYCQSWIIYLCSKLVLILA